ncbi:hypothetical protein ACIPW5_11280 [Streptomyces sp. NPDC090077]|uniref:hypothetical protein n=1 Tax=Streptomyces sp. NPDC090077 TaxID=3365938 RepID=UPI00381179A3
MTTDPLRDAIARDCPHRLADYDGHLAGRQPTPAVTRLWRIEHAISRDPALETWFDEQYRAAQDTDDYTEAKARLEATSQRRAEITEGLK